MGDRITIRDWRPEDIARIAEIHAKMGLDYQIPSEFGPLFCVKKAVIDENGEVIGAATLKLTAEAYLWLDSDIPAVTRTKAVMLLNAACSEDAQKLGLEDVSAWVPPAILRCFRKTMERLGWKKSRWRSMSFLIK